MIKTYNFSDNSTALPLTKAQRVLRSLGDTSSYSPHFFDDGFPKGILHTDAQAVLNVLEDIVFEREELRAKLAAAETSANELRRAAAELIGADPETWPQHGNAPLAIAACVASLQAKLAALEQEANEEDALRERMSGLLTKSVNAIRGEPAELSLHSWHDLPELCNRLVKKLADQTKAADHWMGEACKSHNDLVRANAKLAALLAQEPVAWLYEMKGRIKLETQRLDNYYWMGEGDSWVKGKPLILAAGATPNVEWNKNIRDSVDKLLEQAGYAEDSSARHQLAMMNFDSAGAALACTSDEWLANCPQSVRDLADKIKAGAAPVPQMTGAALASQEPVAEVLLVDGEKVIDASMAFFDSVELGTKLYLAAGAAPVPEGYALLSMEAIKRTLNCLNTPERADLRLVLRDLYAAAPATMKGEQP